MQTWRGLLCSKGYVLSAHTQGRCPFWDPHSQRPCQQSPQKIEGQRAHRVSIDCSPVQQQSICLSQHNTPKDSETHKCAHTQRNRDTRLTLLACLLDVILQRTRKLERKVRSSWCDCMCVNGTCVNARVLFCVLSEISENEVLDAFVFALHLHFHALDPLSYVTSWKRTSALLSSGLFMNVGCQLARLYIRITHDLSKTRFKHMTVM